MLQYKSLRRPTYNAYCGGGSGFRLPRYIVIAVPSLSLHFADAMHCSTSSPSLNSILCLRPFVQVRHRLTTRGIIVHDSPGGNYSEYLATPSFQLPCSKLQFPRLYGSRLNPPPPGVTALLSECSNSVLVDADPFYLLRSDSAKPTLPPLSSSSRPLPQRIHSITWSSRFTLRS